MQTLSFKEVKMIGFTEQKKRELMEKLKEKSITWEHLQQKEKSRMINNEFKIFAASHKMQMDKTGDQMMLDIYGLKIFYPDLSGKLEGVCHCNDVQYTALKELLLRLSHIVRLKVKDGEKRSEYSLGEEGHDSAIFRTD